MKISIVVATYNNPDYLELTVRSIFCQTMLPDEIVIADDGSTNETKELIEELRKQSSVPIVHVWQPDEGFRLAEIRNKAILAASGEYIIQIDGDIVLGRQFIADHISLSGVGYLLQGSRAMMTLDGTSYIQQNRTSKLTPFSRGVKRRENAMHILPLCRYLSLRYRNPKPIYYARGCNMSFFKSDFIAVNGYDESFVGWGHEDSDLTLRMMNNGVRKKYLKFGAVQYHLYHDESKRVLCSSNLDIMEQHRADGVTTVTHGVNNHK